MHYTIGTLNCLTNLNNVEVQRM